MIIEYIRYRIDPERAEAFEAAYAAAAVPLAASPNCIDYELARCEEEPHRYILRIRWDSTEGHLEGFRKSPWFKDFFALIRPFVADIEEMQHYQTTAVAGTGAGWRE